MKQHEFKGKDECVHCHGTSSTQSECVERKWSFRVYQPFMENGAFNSFECDCPVCHYMEERED